MKKPLLLVLTAMLLLSSFASCSRRGQYEDILESQKEAESLADAPQAGANGEANIIGTIMTHYDLTQNGKNKNSNYGYYYGYGNKQKSHKKR